MVLIKEEGETSKPKDPYKKFEEQEAVWTCDDWTIKEWKFRELIPDKIQIQFEAVVSEEPHLCEDCGYSTTIGQKEEDIFFVSKKYGLHFH